MKPPSTLLETRQALDLSQRAFATLLNISRSQLAMAETGRRQLPSVAITRLLQIQQQMMAETALDPDAIRPGTRWLAEPAPLCHPIAIGLGGAPDALAEQNAGIPKISNLADRCRQDAIRCRKMARQLQKNQLVTSRRQQVQPLLATSASGHSISLPYISTSANQPLVPAQAGAGLADQLLEAAQHFDAIAGLLGS